MDPAGNTAEMRHHTDRYLGQLSPACLQLAVDFLVALADKDSEEATQELLDIPGFMRVSIFLCKTLDLFQMRNDLRHGCSTPNPF